MSADARPKKRARIEQTGRRFWVEPTLVQFELCYPCDLSTEEGRKLRLVDITPEGEYVYRDETPR